MASTRQLTKGYKLPRVVVRRIKTMTRITLVASLILATGMLVSMTFLAEALCYRRIGTQCLYGYTSGYATSWCTGRCNVGKPKAKSKSKTKSQ